ncbi:spore germination protein [Paenibacillus prosopidis]|uniref:spore germination protein n=1 Tax=Paenibacillus prosopidis TaxID=630520 RepID=UPI001FE3C330|nr:spore germination protein [Paenibacillus prosopidis]
MVIIVAITGISSFVIPSYAMSIPIVLFGQIKVQFKEIKPAQRILQIAPQLSIRLCVRDQAQHE